LAALFAASLGTPTPPSHVAGLIVDIVEGGTWTLRHPAGPDAQPYIAWRASQTDEAIVDLGAATDPEYAAIVKRDFGLDIVL
jgi:hypothetical protein